MESSLHNELINHFFVIMTKLYTTNDNVLLVNTLQLHLFKND